MMHRSFLPYLHCPQSKEPLELSSVEEEQDGFVIRGELSSTVAKYPIIRGIPRFVDNMEENYASSFGRQWKRWPKVQFESENVGKPMEGHTKNMFDRIVDQPDFNWKESVVLDVGCGSGRFIDIVRNQKKSKVIGIDYSMAVEQAAEHFAFDENVCICQADALNLPVRPKVVDGAYSIGVLHHTADPEKGLLNMAATVKEKGWVALSVYPKGGYYDSFQVVTFRKIFKLLAPLLGDNAPLAYSYFASAVLAPLLRLPIIGVLIGQFFPIVDVPDFRWRLLDTFDSVTPTYQSTHESYEVYQWFKKAGLTQIEPTNWGSTSYHGVVKS